MSSKKLILVGLVLSLWIVPVGAEQRLSEDFVGLLYECEVLPSQADPVWDVAMADPNLESVYANSNGSVLEIDVLATGGASWNLPGQWGAEYLASGTHIFIEPVQLLYIGMDAECQPEPGCDTPVTGHFFLVSTYVPSLL